jgi:putative hydrolase of the HAD superfamily
LLIIFDLDDTLIDTTGSFTPIKLLQSIDLIVKNGFIPPNILEAKKKLLSIFDESLSTKDSIYSFFKHYNIDRKYLDIFFNHVYFSQIETNITPRNGALNILKSLCLDHKLALVTFGEQKRQLEKLKKAGIDSSIFSKIVVTSKKNKGLHYKKIAKSFNFLQNEIFVIGDKIDLDLMPAKKLGYNTIQMMNNRNRLQKKYGLDMKKVVDFQISCLTDLAKVIKIIIG